MMFTLPLSNRFRLLSCLAGCCVALSAAQAADKKPEAHKHHAHTLSAHGAEAKKVGAKTTATKAAAKKTGKNAEAHKESAAKHAHAAHHDAKVQAAKAKHGAHHGADKHHAAAVAAGAGATAAGVAAAGAATVATPDAATAAAQQAQGATAPGTPTDDTPKGAVTGQPLPRYASLRADEVNLRAGPGRRFPILWVYHRRGMPVRIEREFDVWRLIEDSTGQKGWVQQATVAGGRDFLVPGEPPGDESPIADKTDKNGAKIPTPGHMDSRVLGTITTAAEAKDIPGSIVMRSSASADAPVVAVLKAGTVGSVKECAAGSDWCRVAVKQYSGWVSRRAIWGVDAQEGIAPS